jgi:hypothetical protein
MKSKQRHLILAGALACWIGGAFPAPSFGQAQDAGDRTSLPRFGIAAGAGTLGASVQAATALASRTNLRGGFNYFSLSLSGTYSNDHLSYDGKLRLQSAEVLVDQYLKGPFHISGGALIYDGFQGAGNVSVPGGQSLALNGVTYYSAAASPVTGTAAIKVRKAAP